jgi:hypothetical protein
LITQNLLKNQICDELRVYGVSKVTSVNFKNPAERYRISLLRSLEQEHATNISDFFTEYQKIVSNPKIPLLNIELAILVYKSWKNSPQFINNFICLVQKMSYTLDYLDFWRLLLLSCNKSRINNPLNYQLLSVVISKVEWNEKSIPFIRDLVSTVFKIQSFNQKDSIGVISEKKAKQTLRQILIWIDCIFNQCLDLNNEERIFALIRIMEAITKSPDALNFSKTRKTFLPFFNMLKSKFSAKIIFDASATAIDLVYYGYYQNKMLFSDRNFFVKEYSDFENCLKNDVIILSFFRKYHFPAVLLLKLNTLTLIEKNWLVYVLKGNNLRTCPDLPFKLTKKCFHIFNQLYNGFLTKEELFQIQKVNSSATTALIYSQLRANDVSHHVAIEVLRKNIQDQPANIEFWFSTFSLLHNQGLKASQVNIIYDYIDYRFLHRNEKLNLKGRSMENLVTEINDWHNELAVKKFRKKYDDVKFEMASINDYTYEKSENKFIIKQLSSGYELFMEGKLLRHCVFSYLRLCITNKCKIFSLRKVDGNSVETPLVTIELRGNAINQVRGHYNRLYNLDEIKIIQLWAAAENLKIAV